MTTPGERQGLLQRLLDFVERAGNKVPHSALLFALLMIAVILLSHVFQMLGVGVAYQRVNPESHEVEHASTAVRSLLSPEGIRFIFTP